MLPLIAERRLQSDSTH